MIIEKYVIDDFYSIGNTITNWFVDGKITPKKKQGIILLVILFVNMAYYRQSKPLINPSVIEY